MRVSKVKRMTLGPLLLFLFVGGAISIERVFVTDEEQENILENVIRYDNLKKEWCSLE